MLYPKYNFEDQLKITYLFVNYNKIKDFYCSHKKYQFYNNTLFKVEHDDFVWKQPESRPHRRNKIPRLVPELQKVFLT